MKLILSMALLACAAFPQTAQQSPPATPVTPGTVTPEDAPLPVRKTKGAASELEGVSSSEDGVMSLGRYEGGSWSIKPNRVIAYVNQKEVVLRESKKRFAIPVKSVTEVLYGNAVYTRVSQATGNAVLTAGTKNQSAGNLTVVGIIWTGPSGKNGVVLKLDKGDFPNCMNALQTVTGMKAVDTDTKGR